MIRVFFDASVLFAACYSPTGSSRDLIRQAIRGTIQIVVSQHVLKEVTENLTRKAPGALPAFQQLMDLVVPEMVENPTLEELKQAADYIHLKDAPIVAAAVKAKVDYLVTWDRKHFIDVPEVAERSALIITTPNELMDIVAGE
jgi:putative PIN family toxin of toxin-antitoxin system